MEWEALVFANRISPRHHLGMVTSSEKDQPGSRAGRKIRRREEGMGKVEGHTRGHFPHGGERWVRGSAWILSCLWAAGSGCCLPVIVLASGQERYFGLIWREGGSSSSCISQLLGHRHGGSLQTGGPCTPHPWSMVCKLRRYQGGTTSEQRAGGQTPFA